VLAALSDDSRPAPHSLEDLDPAEHLLVWSLRAMATGHGDCPALGQTFERLCGPLGHAALQAHFILVRMIGMSARRQLRVHTPGCPCVGVDETAVVGLVAAAQQALQLGAGDNLLRLRLAFLIGQTSTETVRAAALGLAQTLKLSGRILPVRTEERTERTDEPAALRVIH
jgi:hypothetical protein